MVETRELPRPGDDPERVWILKFRRTIALSAPSNTDRGKLHVECGQVVVRCDDTQGVSQRMYRNITRPEHT